MLEHMGSHLLNDQQLKSSQVPLCGLCLRPSPLCQYFLKKGKGANANPKVDEKKSKGCSLKVNFTYGTAMKSTKNSPCSNVPLVCPLCPSDSPAIWRYSMKRHMKVSHNKDLVDKYRALWEISKFEELAMEKKYLARRKLGVVTGKKIQPLEISETHRSRIPEIR